MDLKEAKKRLKEIISKNKVGEDNFYPKTVINKIDLKAIETILQELDNLQKENEELISEKTKLLLTDLAEANRLYDEENKRCMMLAIENNDLKEKLDNSISKDNIREKMEAEKKIVKTYYGGIKYQEGKIAGLKDLLKEE